MAEHRRRGRRRLDAAEDALAQSHAANAATFSRSVRSAPAPPARNSAQSGSIRARASASTSVSVSGVSTGEPITASRVTRDEPSRTAARLAHSPPRRHRADCHRVVGSVQITPGSALTVRATPTPRITSALSAGSALHDPALERDPAEDATREHGDEADAGDRDREAEAERGDQGEAEADPMERDRRQQHDERRRARQQPRRDADAEDARARSARRRRGGDGGR